MTIAQEIEVLKTWEAITFADGTVIRKEPAGYRVSNEGASIGGLSLAEAQAEAQHHHRIGVAIQILRDSRMGPVDCAESLIGCGADRSVIEAALDYTVLF